VLHVSTELGWRGGEQQVKLISDGLVARGHICRVMSPPGAALLADRQAGGIGVALPLRFGEFDPIAVAAIVREARDMGAQIIHCQTSHAHSLGLRAGRQLGIPVIVSRRVDFPVGGNWLSRRKYLAPEVHYIAISQAIRSVLIQSGISESRISVVHSGVDPERFGGWRGGARDDAAAQEFGAAPGVPLIANAAALTDHKDHATLLRAASVLKLRGVNFKMIIAGAGELEATLQQLHGELELGESVRFVGYLDDLTNLYRGADVFVISSHLEGLCTSILDAMSVGVPVVATRTGGIPEIVDSGNNGLLAPPRDPEALANAIDAMINNPAQARQFAAAGRATVEEKFTNQRMVEETTKVYRNLTT
jgi:glycosyltransferase involved in cell wall biosynthesis